MPWGRLGASPAIASCTALETVMVLAVGSLLAVSVIAETPSTRAMLRGIASVSSMVATSRTYTGPLAVWLTTMSPSWRGSPTNPLRTTVASLELDTRVPAGCWSCELWSACWSDVIPRPRACSLARSALTQISRLGAPTTETELTPGTASMARLTWFSATSSIWASGWGPETANVSTGKALVSALTTVGALVAAGSFPRAPATTRSTSTPTRSALAAVLNATVTVDTPWVDVEVSVSMSRSVEIASSMGLVICVSMVSGLAPGAVVVTRTTGALILGTTATPRVRYE